MSLSVPEAIDMKITLALLLCLTVFLISCGDKPKHRHRTPPLHTLLAGLKRAGSKQPGLVGYDGAAIRHEVDNAIE